MFGPQGPPARKLRLAGLFSHPVHIAGDRFLGDFALETESGNEDERSCSLSPFLSRVEKAKFSKAQ